MAMRGPDGEPAVDSKGGHDKARMCWKAWTAWGDGTANEGVSVGTNLHLLAKQAIDETGRQPLTHVSIGKRFHNMGWPAKNFMIKALMSSVKETSGLLSLHRTFSLLLSTAEAGGLGFCFCVKEEGIFGQNFTIIPSTR